MDLGSPGARTSSVVRAALKPAAQLVVVFVFCWTGRTAWAGVELPRDVARPTAGQSVRLIFSDALGRPVAGAAVVAIYRPGSAVPTSHDIGRTGSDGSIEWIPESAGVVSLLAKPEDPESKAISELLSVRFSGLPGSGIFIMVLAAILLYGGAAMGFRALFRAPPTILPPDT